MKFMRNFGNSHLFLYISSRICMKLVGRILETAEESEHIFQSVFRDLGIMLRKVTLELMQQLRCLRDKEAFQSSRGWLLDGKRGGCFGIVFEVVVLYRAN